MTLPPLEPCHGCGVIRCDYAHTGGTCWGETWLEWEDYDRETGETTELHACRGHTDVAVFKDGTYRLPTDEDLEETP